MTPHSREIPADEEGRHAWEVSSNAQVAEEWRPSSGKGAASPCLRRLACGGRSPLTCCAISRGPTAKPSARRESFGDQSNRSGPEARRIRSHPFDIRSALSAAKAARASVSSYKGFRSCQGNRQVRSVG